MALVHRKSPELLSTWDDVAFFIWKIVSLCGGLFFLGRGGSGGGLPCTVPLALQDVFRVHTRFLGNSCVGWLQKPE